MTRYETARILAADIDRLAYLVDPYEYFDVVGRTEKEFSANVAEIAADLMAGIAGPYIQWLSEVYHDENNDEKDRQRALNRLSRLFDFIGFGSIEWAVEVAR